jgi:hypothetical protein
MDLMTFLFVFGALGVLWIVADQRHTGDTR